MEPKPPGSFKSVSFSENAARLIYVNQDQLLYLNDI